MYSHKIQGNTMQIRVSKSGGKRSTWLVGRKKKRKRRVYHGWLHHQSRLEKGGKEEVCYFS